MHYLKNSLFLLLFTFADLYLSASEHLQWGLPCLPDQLIVRESFAIGYSHEFRQAVWISYILKRDDLLLDKIKRTNRFRADPLILIRPVQPGDYSKTGFDKGHLAPAGDMAFSKLAMQHSFFMSNITPQVPGCNRGIWKRIETQCREFAVKEGEICIITGPVFKQEQKTMGKAEIPVPWGFYKVVLDMTPPMKMIGFLVPNQSAKANIKKFVVSIDEIENTTGLDFFSELPDDIEHSLEHKSTPGEWGL